MGEVRGEGEGEVVFIDVQVGEGWRESEGGFEDCFDSEVSEKGREGGRKSS